MRPPVTTRVTTGRTINLMPAPLDPAVRAAIETELRDGTLLSRNALAKKHGVSGATVTKIARALEADPDEPVEVPFDRTATSVAVAARAQDVANDLKSRRAAEAVAAFEDAVKLRESLWTERRVVVGRGDSAHIEHIDPTARDQKELAIAYGVFIDKSRQLEAAEADPAADGKAAVRNLVDELRARRAAREAAEQETG